MLMRHMWGHGVGHAYCHTDAPPAVATLSLDSADADEDTLHSKNPESHLTTRDERDDTLEDLEGEEIDVRCGSEEELSEEDMELQDPDDEFRDDERW